MPQKKRSYSCLYISPKNIPIYPIKSTPLPVTLWLFNIAMEAMAPIEIDGLPSYKMVDLSSSRTVNVITRW